MMGRLKTKRSKDHRDWDFVTQSSSEDGFIASNDPIGAELKVPKRVTLHTIRAYAKKIR